MQQRNLMKHYTVVDSEMRSSVGIRDEKNEFVRLFYRGKHNRHHMIQV